MTACVGAASASVEKVAVGCNRLVIRSITIYSSDVIRSCERTNIITISNRSASFIITQYATTRGFSRNISDIIAFFDIVCSAINVSNNTACISISFRVTRNYPGVVTLFNKYGIVFGVSCYSS